MKRGVLFWGVLFFLLLLFGGIYSLRITNISYEGNTKYSDEEMTQLLFDKSYSKNPLYCLWALKYQEKKEIPFVETYDIEFHTWNSITVEVYEKSLAGYVLYKDYYIYFDKDGKVVESSKEKLNDVAQIVGLDLSRIVLYEKLPVEEEEIFDLILSLTQMLNKYQISADQIIFEEDKNMILNIDDISVVLGQDTFLNEKIATLADQLPNLQQEKGILYLNEFTADAKGYRFKRTP